MSLNHRRALLLMMVSSTIQESHFLRVMILKKIKMEYQIQMKNTSLF